MKSLPHAIAFALAPLGLFTALTACSSTGDSAAPGDGDGAGDGDGDTSGSGGSDSTASGGGTGVGGSATGGDTGVGGSATGGDTGAGGSATGGGTGVAECDQAVDECFFAGGLPHECATRFALGINYAWHHFAADFGGIAPWTQPGVSTNTAIDAELADMAANGVSVVRWWMFPDFRGDGVLFDADDNPTGISAGAVADIQKALELADAHGIKIVFTIFSFDNFKPSNPDQEGLNVRGMTPMVTDAARRAKLISGIVRPVAQAAAASPHGSALLGWDVINEPEWAISPTGTAQSGQDFEPNPELTPVTLDQMKALINETLSALAEETPSAQKSVGWAAAKWSWAFADVTAVDFHQPHIYEWVNTYWPYTSTPAALGYTGKPTVMGEFFLQASPFSPGDTSTFATIVNSWFTNGYAGAWSWQYNENKANLGLIKAFADEKGCQTKY